MNKLIVCILFLAVVNALPTEKRGILYSNYGATGFGLGIHQGVVMTNVVKPLGSFVVKPMVQQPIVMTSVVKPMVQHPIVMTKVVKPVVLTQPLVMPFKPVAVSGLALGKIGMGMNGVKTFIHV